MIEFRPYQEAAAEWLSRRRRGMVCASAGSGKTVIGGMALSRVLERRGRHATVGVLCNTREQKDQWQAAFDLFPMIAELATVRITCDAVRANFSGCDLLIGDEIHHLRSAPTWQTAVETCNGAFWGFTATPWGEDEEENAVFRSRFYNQIHTISRSEIGDKLTPAVVRIVDASDRNISDSIERETMKKFQWRKKYWKGDMQELLGQIRWHECSKRGIVENHARNQAAIQLAKNHSHESVLILVGQVEHGQELQRQIPFSEVVFSKMGAKKRRNIIERFRSGDCPVMIATSLADEGFDSPIASVLILVSGGKSEGRTIQRAGRVCRKYAGKETATIYDFKDTYHYLSEKHAIKRQEIFRNLGYKITFEGELL